MRFLVVDVETTGLEPVRHRVVWLAAAVVEDGVVTRRWSTLLDPGGGSTRLIGGIHLAGKPSFADIADDLVELLDGAVLVGHNVRFDLAFLNSEFARIGRTLPPPSVVCTMRLSRRLELAVASWSLVDCCAAFDIVHQRRHRADEDVEATHQLLDRLLPLAQQRGWHTADDLVEALRPADPGERELRFDFTVDLEEVYTNWLIETVGWRPEEEKAEAALERWRAVKRVEREARYARMAPPHREAHRMWDRIDDDDDRAQSWSLVLAELAAHGCDEIADAWRDWARRCGSDRAGRLRKLDAYREAATAVLSEPGVTRKRVQDFIWDLTMAAEDAAGGVARLIEWYAEHVDRLAELPACGDCGDMAPFASGCRAGLPCTTASLGDRLFWLLDADNRDQRFHKSCALVTPILMKEPNPVPLARLGAERVRRYIDAGNAVEAMNTWQAIQTGLAAQGRLGMISAEFSTVIGQLLYAKEYQAVVTLLEPHADDTSLLAVVDRFRILDDLARAYERLGLMTEAISTWRRAVEAGSKEQNTYERLSLSLERSREHAAALAVVELAFDLFDEPWESLIKRATRCRKRLTAQTGVAAQTGSP